MATPVYSRRLGSASTTGAATVTVGTVPSGKVWIVRDVIISQIGAGTCRCQLTASGASGYFVYTAQLAQTQQHVEKERHVVLLAGESITFTPRSTTSPWNLAVACYGYELDDP